jgi:NADH:ubiquinone oxidoreductase subunit E
MTKKILVCTNYRANPNSPSCAARGSKELVTALMHQLQNKNIPIEMEEIQCMGYCNVGPNVRLIPSGRIFHAVSTASFKEIIQATKAFLEN